MPQLNLRCVQFNRFNFGEEVAKASGADPETTQVSYLAGYLGSHGLSIRTMLVESPYVDRHYIEEYSRYYATAFRSPSSSTVRIHFFTDDLTDGQLREGLVNAAGGNEQRLIFQVRLQASYRGYIVVRPLPSAPIGRTILAVYSDKESRRFTTQPHRAHLLGLEMTGHVVRSNYRLTRYRSPWAHTLSGHRGGYAPRLERSPNSRRLWSRSPADPRRGARERLLAARVEGRG